MWWPLRSGRLRQPIGHGLGAGCLHGLAYGLALFAARGGLGRDVRGGDGQRGSQRIAQAGALGVGPVLETQAPPRVAFTGRKGLFEARGLADGVAALQQAHDGGAVELAAAVDVAVLARHHVAQFAAVGGHAQPLAHFFGQAGAAVLVSYVARQHIGRGRALAQVVHQAGVAHGQRGVQLRGHVQHHHGVHAGIDLGVVFGALGHAPQALQLGQQHGQRTAFAQQLEHARGLALHQAPADLLPDAFGHQGIHLTGAPHLLHQGHGFRRHREFVEPSRKARHAQDAHRVFAKGVGHMAQHPGLQVGLAAVGIVDGAFAIPVRGGGHGVDGQVAPGQVLLQRDVGRRLDDEAAVARPALALGARQGVLLVGFGMQEDGEVPSHGHEAALGHLLGRGADHDPVAVMHGPPQKAVAHRAAHHVHLKFAHPAMVRPGR